MQLHSLRPPVVDRSFTSPVIEQVIADTCAKIANPELAWLFANCFPNTLDTTITFTPNDPHNHPDTFVITGDIDAMWLRDSTNQVWPYLPFAKDCPKLRALLHGLIRRQATCILRDPYANAFYRTADKISQWKSDHTTMLPGVHERKYELDSLASVLRLAAGYYEATHDAAPFDTHFLFSLRVILDTIQAEQAGTPEQIQPRYSFARTAANVIDSLPGDGHGNPCRRNGLSRSPFRPSDDACIFQYLIPANAMAAVNLRRVAALLDACTLAPDLAEQAQTLSDQITAAIHAHAVTTHPNHGQLFAYEINGFGSFHLMDDANTPNLLSLPYHGFCDAADPLYQSTRRFCLSPDNPYFHKGTFAAGLGSPHIGLGWIWPLGLITQALTSTDDAEIATCLQTLLQSNAGTGFMHEAFWQDNPKKFTRNWFAWANTYFGELVLHLAANRPHLLKESLA